MALGDIAKLIDSGKEKGCLSYGEVNGLIPHDVNPSEVLDDLLATFGPQGIEVFEGQPKPGGPQGRHRLGAHHARD